MRNKLIIGLSVIWLFSGCTPDTSQVSEPPEDLLNEDVYMHIMADLELYNAWVSISDTLYKPDSLRQAVFLHYDVDESRYIRSHQYYQSDFKSQNARIDSVLKMLDKEKIRINEEKESLNQQ